jgi:hypothetical protein
MPTVIWQTGDSFSSKFTIFRETLSMGKGQRVFADQNYAYAVLPNIYRMVQGSGIERHQTIITPDAEGSSDAWIIGHYLNDYATAVATIAMTTVFQPNIPLGSGTVGGPSSMYTSLYPEFADQWVTQSGYPTNTPSDVASPDYPESPRFLIGLAGNNTEKVIVVPITGAILGTRYATNWSVLLSDSAEVTDLETVRII